MKTILQAETDTERIIQLVQRHMKDEHISRQELGVRIGFSRSAISQYLDGKYCNPQAIEEKLVPYLEEKGLEVESPDTTVLTTKFTTFFKSTDARRTIAVCSNCQEFSALGVVVGKSGYGKTYTLKQYARLPRTAYVECDDMMSSRDLVEALEHAVGNFSGVGTVWKRINEIRTFFQQHPGYLIIIDEADKLLNKYTQRRMEVLRAIVDQCEVGLIVAGEPRLESLLKGYLPRFANRVDFFYSLNGLEKEEIEGYLQEFLNNYEIDQDAVDELTARAMNLRNGCFRLFDRTIRNIRRVLEKERSLHISLDVIQKASDMMML